MSLSTQYKSLKDKVVFITGGAGGIGASMVKAFRAQQAKVAFIDSNKAMAEALIDSLPQSPDNELWYKTVDVTDSDALQASVHEAVEHFGGIDVLVNNVGNDHRQDIENISAYDWHKCMQVNLT